MMKKPLLILLISSIIFFSFHSITDTSNTGVNTLTDPIDEVCCVADTTEDVFQVVEDMPRYPTCENLTDTNERNSCARDSMLNYIYRNLLYPNEAFNLNLEGTVVIRFIVEKTGCLSDISVQRSLGGGTDEEAFRIANQMNIDNIRWIPGKQRGTPVRVYFNLPIKFVISDSTTIVGDSILTQNCESIISSNKGINSTPFNVKTYPNPVQDFVIIEIDSNVSLDSNYKIIDVDGKVMLSNTINIRRGFNRFRVDLNRVKGSSVKHIVLYDEKNKVIYSEKLLVL